MCSPTTCIASSFMYHFLILSTFSSSHFLTESHVLILFHCLILSHFPILSHFFILSRFLILSHFLIVSHFLILFYFVIFSHFFHFFSFFSFYLTFLFCLIKTTRQNITKLKVFPFVCHTFINVGLLLLILVFDKNVCIFRENVLLSEDSGL